MGIDLLVRPRPDELYQSNMGNDLNRPPRPVGTRGGCGVGWGPCACPRWDMIPLEFRHKSWGKILEPQANRTLMRTSTRPPHPPTSTPCPYRTPGTPAFP